MSVPNIFFLLQPWHILLAGLRGFANQRQQQIIEFQNSQFQALLKKLGKKCLLFDDKQRRFLAMKTHSDSSRSVGIAVMQSQFKLFQSQIERHAVYSPRG